MRHRERSLEHWSAAMQALARWYATLDLRSVSSAPGWGGSEEPAGARAAVTTSALRHNARLGR